MLYNACSWAPTKATLTKLDAAHRKQMKEILNIRWPATISNINLYKTTNTESLSVRVENSRWKMVGKIFRQPELNPSHSAFIFAHNKINSKDLKGRKGRHRQNLYDLVIKDLTSVNLDVESAKEAAKDSEEWENLKENKKPTQKSERLANKTKI